MNDPARALTELFSGAGLTDEERSYLRFNGRRYVYLLDGAAGCLDDRPEPCAGRPRILDVGPAFQTVLLRERFPDATVNSIGYANRLAAPRPHETHFDFDLNAAYSEESWPRLPEHDLIVMGEVIEHLTTSPLALLRCVRTWAAPGAWLVIQTPNLLALASRIRMLFGRNPMGSIGNLTSGSHNPGHFREYTFGELAEVGRAAGFGEIRGSLGNYFVYPGMVGRLYGLATALAPKGMRQGITMYLKAS